MNRSMTIAIPTYKRFSFLEKTLPKYLLLQEVQEIIIGDETGEDIDLILKQTWGSNSKFTFLRNKERMGAYHNKLNVLKYVKTEWVALIDSDNEVSSEYFQPLFNYWNLNGSNPKYVYLPADIKSIDIRNPNDIPSYRIRHFENRVVDKSGWNQLRREQNADYALNMGNCVFHRDANFYMPDSIQKDVMVECKLVNKLLLMANFSLVFVPKMTYNHIAHHGSHYLQNQGSMINFNSSYNWTI
jgi:glycosyltransferase involved in cell wall biosynthesis